MTGQAMRDKLICLVDQAMRTTKQGESVYAVLAKLLVHEAIIGSRVDAALKNKPKRKHGSCDYCDRGVPHNRCG